ncbi:hypothetical protein AB4Z52_27465 [Rhizobium sp. 2YAF20]|uniref:hypothetical protein n=1 Tax=Rhizobium sp. 2YAF20 TaxID=3233027 RepID=UPI003F9C74C7
MAFPSPKNHDPDDRLEEAANEAFNALELLLAEANKAGWGTREITQAFVLAAEALKASNDSDPDPSEDQSKPTIGPEQGQVGHGEIYD